MVNVKPDYSHTVSPLSTKLHLLVTERRLHVDNLPTTVGCGYSLKCYKYLHTKTEQNSWYGLAATDPSFDYPQQVILYM